MNLVKVGDRGFNLDQLVEWRAGGAELTLVFAQRDGGTKVFLFNDDAKRLLKHLVNSSVDLEWVEYQAGIEAGAAAATEAYTNAAQTTSEDANAPELLGRDPVTGFDIWDRSVSSGAQS